MALNLQSLSITSVFNSIVNFFRSQENNSRWRDLTTGSEGSFLIRLLSNVFSAISYRIVAQSRENFLTTAALQSSCTGIAVNLGYSVFRGSNLKRWVTLTPSKNYTFPNLSVIGTYSPEYDIIALTEEDGTDLELIQGEPKEFKVVVGKIKEETFVTGTDAIKIFSLFTTGISEDYVLFLENQEVPTTKVIKDMIHDKYLVRTNPFGSVDIAYLNTFAGAQHRYGTGSEITIRYVELADVDVKPFTADMFPYGELVNVSNISNYMPYESVDSIKVNAPLDHEVQNLIRSKADYALRLKEIIPAIIDTNYKALTPTYTLISYLKNDNTLLSATENDTVIDLLREENFFGTPLPDITHPRREVAHLKITVELLNKYKNISDVNEDIQNIINNAYNKALGVNFDVYDLERRIETLSYVKYARVSHVVNTRKLATNYQLGYILEQNGNYYKASKILGVSGSTPLNWSSISLELTSKQNSKDIDLGLEIEDGSILWRIYKRLPGLEENYEISKWHINTQYGIGDYVYDEDFNSDFMLKCVDIISKTSGANPPSITYAEIGDFITDGSVVWVVKDYSSENATWQPLKTYRLGDSVNLTSLMNYSLECVSYLGTTDPVEDLDFEQKSYEVLSQTTNAFTVSGNKEYYFQEGDVFTAAHAGGYTAFSVVHSVYDRNTSHTVITVNPSIDTDITYTELITTLRGTRDGQILWTLIDDMDNITYDWNSYVTFTHELEVIGS